MWSELSLGTITMLVAGIAVILALVYVAVRVAKLVIRWRGTRLVRCPENLKCVAVRVDAGHAAASGLLHEPELRLNQCTRWPEKKDCGQECLSQITDAPEDCLLRNIAARWYEGKSCVHCGRSLSEFQWPDFRCGLLLPGGVTKEWRDLAPETLPAVLDQALPVCWNCHVADTFRHRHPDLVTDRPGNVVGPMGEREGVSRSDK